MSGFIPGSTRFLSQKSSIDFSTFSSIWIDMNSSITLVDHFHMISVDKPNRFLLFSRNREREGAGETSCNTRDAEFLPRYRRSRHQLIYSRILRNAGCNHLLSVVYIFVINESGEELKKSDPALLSPKLRASARTAASREIAARNHA